MPKKKNEKLSEVLTQIVDSRNLPEDIIKEALAEAMEKAYRKHCGFSELPLRTTFEDGKIAIYIIKDVADPVEDEEFQISLEDARKIQPGVKVGDTVEVEASFDRFERSDIMLAKNVMKQKIREAEKAEVYEKYCDHVGDLVNGIVQTVDDKHVAVMLGGTVDGKPQPGSTLAIMKRSDQIPTETYREGQPIQVDIVNVDKESKGAIVTVSRSDPNFVKRLFEKEVPEIFNGIIEIKAIARDPGMRAKMAVYSHNENIDPIGACIGPRGSRVQAIISELNGEKIDIFEWSDDMQKLVANALSPAQGVQVFKADGLEAILDAGRIHRPSRDGRQREERKSLVAAVPDDQLSLAIGKKGQNAKLAFRLTGYRIDIRSQSELEEKGIDWQSLVQKMHDEYEEAKAQEKAYKQRLRIEELKASNDEAVDISGVDFHYEDEPYEELSEDNLPADLPAVAVSEEPAVNDEMAEAARIAKEMRKSLAERRSQYVSRLETPEPAKPASAPAKKAEPKKEEAKKPEKKKPAFNTMHPIYTEEELREIENEELEEEANASWNDDVDYEEYDSYYDDEY